MQTNYSGVPSQQSEWPSLKGLPVTNAGEGMEKRDHPTLLVGK